LQSPPKLRLGTRGSALALTQATLVARLLREAHGWPEDAVEIKVITTSGDRLTEVPLSTAGGKGLFSREIEAALLAGEVDAGVHSSKDMATILPAGLVLPVFLEREDVRDAFVSRTARSLDDLPQGARLGSSSIRRASQMLRARPDLVIVPFRGNVDTRLRKLDDGVADATLLAVAGLNRLGRAETITDYLDPKRFPPAPAQGAIGIEIRSDDERAAELIAPLNHEPTRIMVSAERAMLRVVDGSCRTPLGVYSELNGDTLAMTGQLLSPDGSQAFTATESGPAGEAEAIGTRLGHALLTLAGPDFVVRFFGD
jgi:hydroxymethylbilane synthase